MHILNLLSFFSNHLLSEKVRILTVGRMACCVLLQMRRNIMYSAKLLQNFWLENEDEIFLWKGNLQNSQNFQSQLQVKMQIFHIFLK